jgi:hypothetical protein
LQFARIVRVPSVALLFYNSTKRPVAVRDEWEAKKDELAKTLSDLLGETWTMEVNANALYPYATTDYAKNSLGSCIYSYAFKPTTVS